jgi:hypothetical protein
MDDAPTYQLLKSCKTTAVFQLESRGMKDLIRRLQPDRFGDIVALVALFRPGPCNPAWSTISSHASTIPAARPSIICIPISSPCSRRRMA